jgi:hypothetical protein
MRTPLLAITLFAIAAMPVAAQSAGWRFEQGRGAAALVFGTPVTDRDAFRLDCTDGNMSISTWAASTPRGVTDGSFPTTFSVFFGNRELVFTATGRVTGPDRNTRIDARIPEPGAFLASLGQVQRLTTVIFAGRRMAPVPAAVQAADFRKACGF